MTDPLSGKTLGAFEILEEVGRGGMASVYRARQKSMNRIVAVKVLPPALLHDPGFYERFAREVDVVSHLEHPHILPIYDYGESDGVPYIAMRFLGGGSLAQRIRRGTMLLEEVVRPIVQIGAALDYAHQQGIIHRDLKPGNIMLDEAGNAYLADFGIARVVNSKMTGNAVLGTPAYMAPEQASGEDIDGRSDQYALGIVLYEMLTGREPFEGETPVALLLKHLSEPMPSVRALRPEVPFEVEAIIYRATAKIPDDRYKTAGAMAAALQDALGGTRVRLHAPDNTVTRTMADDEPLTLLPDGSGTPARLFRANLRSTPPGLESPTKAPPLEPPPPTPYMALTNAFDPGDGATVRDLPPTKSQAVGVESARPRAQTAAGSATPAEDRTRISQETAALKPTVRRVGRQAGALVLAAVGAVALVVVGVLIALNAQQPVPTSSALLIPPTPFPGAQIAARDRFTLALPIGWRSSDVGYGSYYWDDQFLNPNRQVNGYISLSLLAAPAAESQTTAADEAYAHALNRYASLGDPIDQAQFEDGSLRYSFRRALDSGDTGQMDVFYLPGGAFIIVAELYTSDVVGNALVPTMQAILDSIRLTGA